MATGMPRRLALSCLLLCAVVGWVHAVPDSGAPGEGLDNSEYSALRTVTFIGAGLSVLGTVFIMFTYQFFPELHTFPYKLIVFLSLANFCSSLSFFLDSTGTIDVDPSPGAFCIVGAGMSQFFDLASFMWTTVIAFNILQVLVYKKGRAVERYEKWYHMVSWGIPFVFLIIAIATKSFGDTGVWCWITDEHDANRFFLYYVPLMIILVSNAALYYTIVKGMRNSSRSHAINFRLRLYLLVFVFLRIWGAVNVVHSSIAPKPVFALFFLQALFSPLQGFANAMVYGFNLKVRQQYRQRMCVSRHDIDNPLANAVADNQA